MDDDEELAAMRQQRKQRLGAAGVTRGEVSRQAREAVLNVEDLQGPPSDDLRSQFPMSFGKKKEAAAELIGPPRPGRLSRPFSGAPAQGDTAMVGSPRPSNMAGPPRPSDGSVDTDADMIGPPRPPDLATAGTELSTDMIGPPRPPDLATAGAERSNAPPPPKFSDSTVHGAREQAAEAARDALPQLPVSNEMQLKGHHKIVSALDVDRSGARVITGGMDYQVCIYDFNGMKADGKPFRELMPQEGHPVHAVSFSPSGEAFIVATGEPRAKVYDRDGRELGEFKRGDMYIRDLKNTKGHVSGCTHGQWHPLDRFTAMTSSGDGTIRLWDCDKIEQKMVIKPTGASGRVPFSACCYSPDGGYIAGAMNNGMIQLWSATGNFGRSAALDVVNVPAAQMPLFGKQTWKYASAAKHTARNAHAPGTEASDLRILRDGVSLLSRADDDTLKLWDIRLLKQPVHVWEVPASHTHTRMCTSPQEELVLTGSVSQESGAGTVVAFRLKPPYDLTHRVGMPANVTAVAWHLQLNQILVGCGDRTVGAVHVLYSPERSDKGALLCAGKQPRAKNPLDFQPAPIIHTPGALPMFRDDSWRKRKRTPDGGAASKKAQIPDPGPNVAGAGGGGKIGASSNTLLTQYLLEQGGMKKLEEQLDPREAILRHKDADKDMAVYLKAYEKTQPQKLFSNPDEEEGGKK